MSLLVTMPGKIGDLLFSVAVIRELAKQYGPAVVVTSWYCKPAAKLLLRLPCIDAVSISNDYRSGHTHFGMQPWDMSPWFGAVGAQVFQLGLRHFPRPGQTLPDLIGEPYGVTPLPGPWLLAIARREDGPVAVHAPVGAAVALAQLVPHARRLGRTVRLIGTRMEIDEHLALVDPDEFVTVSDYVEILEALHGCSVLFAVNSGPSILALGGGLPVVWPHREGIEEERWVPRGCSAATVDHLGTLRGLRGAVQLTP